MRGRSWTTKEITFLKEHWLDTPTAELAKQLNRSVYALYNAATQHGLPNKTPTGGSKKGIKHKPWSAKEDAYLEERWGNVSVPMIAKHLGRSEAAVTVRAQRLDLGAFLDAGEYVTLNQLQTALGYNGGSAYFLTSWVKQRGLKVKTKQVKECSFRVVYLADFWKWAEQNRVHLDFSKMEPNALGKEPAWLNEQRRLDSLKAMKYRAPKEPWTPLEDETLRFYLKQHRYTYHELSQTLGRTCGAIQRRCLDLGIQERPVKADNTISWTEEELDLLAQLIKSGMSYELMAEQIGRSSKALRGKTWQTYRTEKLDAIARMMGSGGWGSGQPERTVKHDFRRVAVKNDLTRLCQALLYRRNQLAFDGYWQKSMCMLWDDLKGCTAEETDCDSCVSFVRIREQVCARCGGSFFERRQNRFCHLCRVARKKQYQRRWVREHARAG